MSSSSLPTSIHDDVLKSTEDLLARIQVANENRIFSSNTTSYPIDAGPQLGLPTPFNVTNAQLRQLKGIYIEVVKNIRDEGINSIYLQPLFHASEDPTKPDGAILMLHFLDYPGCVRAARPQKECDVQEAFEMMDEAERITYSSALQTWCRKALVDYQKHHTLILVNVVSHLGSIQNTQMSSEFGSSTKKLKNFVRQAVFLMDEDSANNKVSTSDDDEGMKALRADLARMLYVRKDLPGVSVANAIHIQFHLFRVFNGNDGSILAMRMQKYSQDQYASSFEMALTRCKASLGDDHYNYLRCWLGLECDMEIAQTAHASVHSRNQVETIQCNREGCTSTSTTNTSELLRCSRCKLANYCSKECQVQDWTNGHKSICNKKQTSVSQTNVQAAAAARARLKPNPLLDQQDQSIAAAAGQHDYLFYNKFVHAGGESSYRIKITDPGLKARYYEARKRKDVRTIYDALCRATDWWTPSMHLLIRAQLQAEYGFDPLSDQADSTAN